MKEIKREFALFGNFTKVDFDYVIKLRDELINFGLTKVGGAPDVSMTINNFPMTNTTSFNVRPQLSNIENNIVIFWGSSRINIDLNNISDDSLEEYKSLIKKIISLIFSDDDFSVNRIALNGNIELESQNIQSLFEKFLRKSNLYSSLDEVGFRINSCIFDQNLNNLINRIITLQNNGNKITGLYDYNTKVLNDRKYSMEDVQHFMNSALKYRDTFLAQLF